MKQSNLDAQIEEQKGKKPEIKCGANWGRFHKRSFYMRLIPKVQNTVKSLVSFCAFVISTHKKLLIKRASN